MKKIFLALVLLCQINPAFSYDENDVIKRINSLNTTFMLQSANFFSEVDKLNKLAEDPKAKQDHLQMLYITSVQSLCISVIALEQTKNLIEKNPQVIGGFLTRDNVDEVNYKASVFKNYLKEFDLDNQGCKGIMPFTYDSMMNN